MPRQRGQMKPCPCTVCRCDKRVSVRRPQPCDYCSADTHRVDRTGAIVPREAPG